MKKKKRSTRRKQRIACVTDKREKDVGSGTTNGNEELCVSIGIGEPKHDASTSDEAIRENANGKGRRAYLDFC